MPSPADAKQEQKDAQHEEFIKSDGSLSNELTLDEALQLFDDAKKYVDTGMRKDWDRYFKVYDGKRVYRNYDGVSDPVIREAHTIIETLVSNIAGGDVKFHFVPTNEEQSKDTEVLNDMLDYWMECNQMKLKNQEWVREMLLYGTAILHVSWKDGEPFIENIPLRDFFVDPTSTGLVRTINPALYAGYEYLADKDELAKQQIYDPEANDGEGGWVARYNIPTDIGKPPSPNGEANDTGSMDKAFKDMFKGSTLGDKATEKQIHVIRLYHLPTGRLYEIGNKKAFIYNKPTWCQREEITRTITVADPNGQPMKIPQKLDKIEPFLPFAVLRDYIDSSQFYGTGEMALLIHDAELLNDYEAMDVDNNAYQNTPMYWIDPQYADLAPEIETIPGAVYPIPRNAMGAIERPQLSGDLDQKKERIMERMRRATAADEAVQGVSQSGSRTTATEVSTQLQQAQMRFQTKIQNLESEGFAQLALVLFKMAQIFITKKTAVRIVGKMGIFFKDFDPWEYNGKWEAHAQLDSTIKRQQVEVGQKNNQIYEMMSKDPQINQTELNRWMAQKLDPTLTDEQFNKMLQQAPTGPSPEELKLNADVEKAKIAASAQIYQYVGPMVKGEIETSLGYKPDPQLMGDAHNRMLEQANQGADHMNPLTDAKGSTIPGADALLAPPAPSPAQAPAGLSPAHA